MAEGLVRSPSLTTGVVRLLRDLGETAGLRVELIESREAAEQLVRTGKRPAVLVLGPRFSRRVARCSFLSAGGGSALTRAALLRPGDPVLLAAAGLYQEGQTALPLDLTDGLNPFFRDGVKLDVLDVEVLRDETQQHMETLREHAEQDQTRAQTGSGAQKKSALPKSVAREDAVGEDEVTEQSMESFPASDPPASY